MRIYVSFIAALFLAGCSYALNTPLDPNQNLYFLPQKVDNPQKGGKTGSANPCSEHCSSLRPQPGMTLRFLSLGLSPTQIRAQPVISQFDWVLPDTNTVSRDDVLAIHYLLVAGFDPKGDDRINLEHEFNVLLNSTFDPATCSNASGDGAACAVLKVTQSIRIAYPNLATLASPPTALSIRDAVCRGDRFLLKQSLGAPVLSFDGPRTGNLQISADDTWYYNLGDQDGLADPIVPSVEPEVHAPNLANSLISKGDFKQARVSVSVLMPIYLRNGPALPPAPVCMSVADLENQLSASASSSVRVIEIYRHKAFAQELLDQAPGHRVPESSVIDGDFVRIAFADDGRLSWGHVLVPSTGGTPSARSLMLLAPGDVIVLNRPVLAPPSRLN